MTPKQEQFARLYVETGNASEAYRQAYNADNMKPETVTNEAYKLLQDPDISAMVDDLKAEARQRHAVTVGDLLHELEQARAAALAAPTPQSSAAVSATMGKAKMLGLLVDKAEIKAEAEISTKQEEYTPPLTGDEVQQVIKSFFNKPYSEITLEDIIGTVGEDTDRIGYVITMIIVDKKF
ncbi:terminase small subunit [Neisseria mucosa]|uniref:Terminase small subunit n=1 Tax=Neisseria mucosa TaxID=488 RepID=A0AAW6Z996_NEIMU|nr:MULTISPECIES: terminase small subunit [Neisseriaceae]MDK6725625.1 terminase small subunit [Neisseria mucosa]MDK6869991.1 terminase small subunit [Neisseria mucosa]MDK8109576.1 terminase small subunit [Neisseria mucosa]MDK8360859.1 terminase small subunit [Neisseria mucosa]